MDERLRRRAHGQGGVFTWPDAKDCLLGEAEIRSALRRGEAVRVRRDAYVLMDLWRDARPETRLALRTRAVLLTRPGDLASHQSALVLHGIAVWGLPMGTVHLVSAVRRSRKDAGVRIRPRPKGVDAADAEGAPTVPVAVALAQVALSEDTVSAVVSLDHALHTRACTLAAVEEAGAALARGPLDRARLAAVISRCDAKSESVGESRARLLLEDLGYQVRSQVGISDADGDFVGRVDLMIGGLLVVEFDGMVKYEGAQGRRALAQEKAREERLTALGCVVVRLVWSDLDAPDRVRSMVQAALCRLAARAS